MAIKIVKRNPESLPAQTVAASPVTEPPKVPAPPPTPTPQPEAKEAPTASPAHVESVPSKPLGTVQGQTLMDAIKEFAHRGPKDKRTLMVIKRDNTISYKVSSHDLGTGRTVMVSTEGIEIRPIITPRENDLYYPMWR